MNIFIRQLTGIRFVAAAWVLLYHLQGPLTTVGIFSIPVFGSLSSDVLRVGRLGVDLFFALSGFILTHTYLQKLGPKLQARATFNFWWLRLARIYPVAFVMLNVAGIAVIAQGLVTGDRASRDWLNPIDYIKNLLLIQEWGPNPQRGWNFVAWSLSMEWLAYLIFPLLVLALFVFHNKLKTMYLGVLWVLCLVPLLVYGTSRSDAYYTDNWGSTLRILTEFTAGALTYLFIRRFIPEGSVDPRRRVQRLATTLSWFLPLMVIVGTVILCSVPGFQAPVTNTSPDAEPLPPYFHLFLVPLLIAWIGALALSRQGIARTLSGDKWVLGGYISYSLYMTHLVWFGLWRAGMKAVHINSGVIYDVMVLVLIAGAIVIAYAMWKYVEEPAREWMRGLMGNRRKPTEELGEEIGRRQRGTDPAEPVRIEPTDS